jgi:hypothetical protein
VDRVAITHAGTAAPAWSRGQAPGPGLKGRNSLLPAFGQGTAAARPRDWRAPSAVTERKLACGSGESSGANSRWAIRSGPKDCSSAMASRRPSSTRRVAWKLGSSPRTYRRSGCAGTSAFYAGMAAAYAEAASAGHNRPIDTIAQALGRSRNTVKDVIREARARGLLTETTHGRAGGRLTARAKRLLKPRKDESAGPSQAARSSRRPP